MHPTERPAPYRGVRRSRGRRAAALTTCLCGLVLAAMLTPTVGSASTPPASITVSKTSIDPTGESVTVTGTGFDPAAHTGTRPPLVRQPSGVYVAFGRFGDPWKPSAGAPSSSREILVQKWALPAAQKAALDPSGSNPDLVLLESDGTFTVTLPIAPGGLSAGSYGVAVYPASGAVNAAQETFVPIGFATATTTTSTTTTTAPPTTPPDEPGTGSATGPEGQTLQVTPSSELDPDGHDLVVAGSGYDPSVGIYLGLCVDRGPTLPPSPCLGGSGESAGTSSSAWITDNVAFASLRTAPFGSGGSFSVTIRVAAADEFMNCLSPGTRCVVASRADHTASADRSADVKIPVSFQGQDPTDRPTPPAATPSAALDLTSITAGGQLTVTANGFLPGEQVQVWLHSEPRLIGVTTADDRGGVEYPFAVPADTPPGVHHVELVGVTSGIRVASPDVVVTAAGGPMPTQPGAPATATSTGSLPATGASTGLLFTAGLLVLALGAGLRVVASRQGSDRSRA